MTYNLTGLDTGNNLFDYLTTINDAVNGTIATFFLFIIWVILLIGMKNYDTRVAFISSSAIITLLTVLFWGIGLVGFGTIFFPIAALFGGLIWKALS